MMGWNIGCLYNDVVISDEYIDTYISIAEDNFVYLYKNSDGTVPFDHDAMEHKDHLWNDWSKELLLEARLDGTVIFGSVEGDNKGHFWGHKFASGEYEKLDKIDSLKFLLQLEENK